MAISLQLLVILTLLATASLAYPGDNWRSRTSAEIILTPSDIEAENVFGKNIASRILAAYAATDNEALNRYINLLGQTLISNTNRPELDFHFAVLESETPCTYAAPGGYIFISKATLKTLQDEAELAGVVAHEIAHVLSRKVVNRFKVVGDDETTNLAHLISGNAAALLAVTEARKGVTIHSPLFADAVASGYDFIHTGGYDEKAEQQADIAALNISILSGYDPEGLARFIKRYIAQPNTHSAQCSSLNYLAERLENIEVFLKQQSTLKIPLQKNTNRLKEALKNVK